MKLVNRINESTEEIYKLLTFAACLINVDGCVVHVSRYGKGPRYSRIIFPNNILLHIPMSDYPYNFGRCYKKLQPIEIFNWRESLIFEATHEFTHYLQLKRRIVVPWSREGEEDADWVAHARIREFRTTFTQKGR